MNHDQSQNQGQGQDQDQDKDQPRQGPDRDQDAGPGPRSRSGLGALAALGLYVLGPRPGHRPEICGLVSSERQADKEIDEVWGGDETSWFEMWDDSLYEHTSQLLEKSLC